MLSCKHGEAPWNQLSTSCSNAREKGISYCPPGRIYCVDGWGVRSHHSSMQCDQCHQDMGYYAGRRFTHRAARVLTPQVSPRVPTVTACCRGQSSSYFSGSVPFLMNDMVTS